MKQLPLTLRELSGLSSVPAKLADSVVIIVDAQKEYTEGSLKLDGIEKSIDAMARFLVRVRALNVPVIHVVQKGKIGGKIMNPETPFVEIIDKVKPVVGELIITKTLPSSFKGTTLQEELEKIGKKDLIITGYMTHMCLNSTVRDAAELGYRCAVISELTATRDLPDGQEGIIPAAVVKSANLAALADRFAIVVENSEQVV
jgi:nicotinamidase-related amidase